MQLLFHHLESLKLSSINAERIWESQLLEACQSAINLKSLIVKGCGSLQHLLSPSIARSLAQLTQFEIGGCRQLREIISSTDNIEQEENVVICFPKLNSLKVRSLENLVNFCRGNYNIEFPELKVMEFEDCPLLEGIINEPQMKENCEFSTPALFNKKVNKDN